jgi:hypothetical protein
MGDQLDTKDLGYSVKNNYDVLRKASGELKAIIERKFDDAFKAADEASMQVNLEKKLNS